ncbi:MAG: phage portal protein [Clostridia bacterium]|nr:phage portal protein [Clostridia bacterium]
MAWKRRTRNKSPVGFLVSDEAYNMLTVPGYTRLDQCPEIMTAVRRIAELLGSLTIHLMCNTEKGDDRITNELSRLIDINPMPTMTRATWIQAIVNNLLLHGEGNSVVLPHTKDGYLEKLEPISASRVVFEPQGYDDYFVYIDGIRYAPADVLHFTYNPDSTYMWKGRGVTVSLRDIAKNLQQAQATKNAFMSSKWKPSLIVKIDAMTGELSDKKSRQKIIDSYLHPQEDGAPWIIPAEQFQVEQIKPLSLADLAINEAVQLDKRTVASVFGVPPFLLGVEKFNRLEWNSFVQNTIRPLAISLQQEMTKKLILLPKWYLKFNVLSLMDWDLQTIYTVFGGLSDKGIVSGNEVRDRIGMSPREGLDDLNRLENYIPVEMSGKQKKLIQDDKKGDKEDE